MLTGRGKCSSATFADRCTSVFDHSLLHSRLSAACRSRRGYLRTLEIEQYQRSIVTFPLVGLLLGAIAGAVALLLQPWCGVPLAALFGDAGAGALLTGGFHLDGLADTLRRHFLRPHPRSDAGNHARQPAGHPRRAGADLRAGGESAGGWRAAAACGIHPHRSRSGGLRRRSPGMAVLLMYRHRYARKRGWAICLS